MRPTSSSSSSDASSQCSGDVERVDFVTRFGGGVGDGDVLLAVRGLLERVQNSDVGD